MPGQVILKKRKRPEPLPPPGDIVVTCAAGVAPILAGEIERCGERVVRTDAAAVRVAWRPGAVQRLNRSLRTASRVLLSLLRAPATTYDAVYHAASELPWDVLLPVDVTFAITASTRSSTITDHRFLAMRVKDAICDRQRAVYGRRSSVDRDRPGLMVTVFADEGEIEISLDSSGRPLHERGWRVEAGEAPLRETVAATMLLSAGWPNGQMLIDPFCGSGTIAIEAALLAAGRLPWAAGRRFAWQRWRGLDAYLGTLGTDAGEERREEPAVKPFPRIIAADSDPGMIAIAERNAERAGVAGMIEFRVADIRDLLGGVDLRGESEARGASGTESAPGRRSDSGSGGGSGSGAISGVCEGLLITNPPYGQRLNPARVRELYRTIGERARTHLAGWRIALIAGNPALLHELRLTSERVERIYNGGILCDFATYRIRRSTDTGK